LGDEPQNLLENVPWDGDLGHLEGDVAAVADYLAPILISFSFRLVSDQSLIGSGVASVRRKFPPPCHPSYGASDFCPGRFDPC
jgi:hypothetical protein